MPRIRSSSTRISGNMFRSALDASCLFSWFGVRSLSFVNTRADLFTMRCPRTRLFEVEIIFCWTELSRTSLSIRLHAEQIYLGWISSEPWSILFWVEEKAHFLISSNQTVFFESPLSWGRQTVLKKETRSSMSWDEKQIDLKIDSRQKPWRHDNLGQQVTTTTAH